MLGRGNLHNYQESAVKHILENPLAGLFLEMGLGKTVSVLTALEFMIYQDVEVGKVLLIAPKRVAENVWTNEITKWSHLNHMRISVVAGTAKKRTKALEAQADIYAIGRDNVQWLCHIYKKDLPFDTLVIDESSSFKNSKSLRFKALKKKLDSFDRRIILTGTPAPNGLKDVWSQIFILDQGERLGRFSTHYLDQYFTKGFGPYGKYTLRRGGKQEIHDKIADIVLSMKAKDYLELPPRINNTVEVHLSPSERSKYDEFEKEQILEMEEAVDGEISAVNALALMIKLRQFANGFLYDSEKDVHIVHEAKINALGEILESAQGKPVLLAYNFQQDRDIIMSRFKSLKPRQLKTGKDIKDWNAKKISLMIMHPASGGHGLNLQAGGSIIVWFGVPWSLELYQQFNARLDRQGQTETTLIHHIILKDSIDEDIMTAIDKKAITQNNLMESINKIRDKYV